VDIGATLRALEIAKDAVIHRYLYPVVYDHDRAAGIHRRYALTAEPILVWLALAALGGIIGGASYDVVKLAMRKVLKGKDKSVSVRCLGYSDPATGSISIGVQKVASIWLSDEQLDALISGMESYVQDQSRDSRAVAKRDQAILAELPRIVDGLIPFIEELLRANGIEKQIERNGLLEHLCEHLEQERGKTEFPKKLIGIVTRGVQKDD